MTETNGAALDQALQRFGDDLYRLAVLLAPDASRASAALLRAARRLAASPDVPDERRAVEALVAALPAERARPRRLPSWAYPAGPRASDGELLRALARLPHRQRLALGLAALRSFEGLAATEGIETTEEDRGTMASAVARSGSAAPTSPPAAPAVRSMAEDRRDALLALAPHALPEADLALLADAEAPEECRAARAALLLDDARTHADPAIRGHLALCAGCR
ncbi:MAG TPA: hypothetical protein VNL77_12250, partial [Roseiflexaceae bacterium]|nr:hypothetical protein [Roseiflexaceae bacterium]